MAWPAGTARSVDITARVSFGYFKDLLTDGPGDQLRVSSAYVDFNDRELGLGAAWAASRAAWPASPAPSMDCWPAGSGARRLAWASRRACPPNRPSMAPTRNASSSDWAPNLATADRRWDATVYGLAQQYHGEVDRRSVGVEAHYVQPGRTLVCWRDYDVHFADLNMATLVGTLVTDSQLDVQRRRQPAAQPDAEYPQCADRPAHPGLRGPAAAVHRCAARAAGAGPVRAADAGGAVGLPPAGGPRPVDRQPAVAGPVGDARVRRRRGRAAHPVATTPSPATCRSAACSCPATCSPWRLRYERNDIGTQMSFGVGSRFPIGSALRLTTRLRVDRRTIVSSDSQQWLLLPSLRMDYVRGRNTVEFESGAELGRNTRHHLLRPEHAPVFQPGIPHLAGPADPMSRALVLLLALLPLAAVAGQPRRVLDRSTGATVVVSQEPWQLSLDQPHLAANSRDYVALYAVEVNIAGTRHYYLAVFFWSTVPGQGELRGRSAADHPAGRRPPAAPEATGQDPARPGHQQVAARPAGARRPARHL